jgi:hypothetical protein
VFFVAAHSDAQPLANSKTCSWIALSPPVTPEVELTNKTDININVNLSLELFKISGTFDPIVGDDSPFDKALVDFEQKFDIASFPIFNETFDLLFGSQGVGAIAV